MVVTLFTESMVELSAVDTIIGSMNNQSLGGRGGGDGRRPVLESGAAPQKEQHGN